MSDYKTCPIELAGKLASGTGMTLSTTNDPKRLPGVCGENSCAWWDELKQCCAVLTIARAARQK